MKTAKIISIISTSILLLSLITGCSSSPQQTPQTQNQQPEQNSPEAESPSNSSEVITIKGITDLVPHSELIEFVTPKLAEQGIEIVLVSTAADDTTNEKTARGEVDFNFHQHLPYLDDWNKTNGFNLVSVGDIHVEPITAYSDKYDSKDDISDNAVVAIPNNGTNEYRALRILEQNGFIVLNEDTATSLSASLSDIKEYIRPITIIELDAAQIIPTKDDYDFFITNTNKALEARITSTKLFSEGSDSPYANIIAVDETQKDNPAIIALVEALQSEETRNFILEKYNGAVIPANLN